MMGVVQFATRVFFLLFCIFNGGFSSVFGQIDPKEKGFTAYSVEIEGDTVDFFIAGKSPETKDHLLLHISGSWPAPLWIETDPCCVSTDPFNYALIPENYAYVVISKNDFPFSEGEDFEIPHGYWKENTLDFRVNRTNAVIRYIQENIFSPKNIVVVGTSQGSDVAAKLATISSDVTHLGFWAGGGLPQLMEFVMFARKDAVAGKITEMEASRRIDSLFSQFEEMFRNPRPDLFWDGNSYLNYVSFSEPPVNNLLKLEIPIFAAIGTMDTNVAVENAYIIPIEFIRHRKTNLTFRHFPNLDHNFVEKLEDGTEVDRFDEVTKEFLEWVKINEVSEE